MMKGGDNYVPKMTHFPKREIPKKPPPSSSEKTLDSETIPEPVPRKILLASSTKKDHISIASKISGSAKKRRTSEKGIIAKAENETQNRKIDSETKNKKIRKKSTEETNQIQPVTPMKSKIKPMPKIKNFRTLQKDIIPERLKMGRCRTVLGNILSHTPGF